MEKKTFQLGNVSYKTWKIGNEANILEDEEEHWLPLTTWINTPIRHGIVMNGLHAY